jgi:acyl-lipid omega-6 desaturase (Delta-12 desaturase)
MVTNVALAGTMIALVGVKAFLCICRSCSRPRPPAFGCPTFSISLSINSDSKGENWKLHDAALHGSSHYDLPGVLRWFTAIIGACAKHAISAVAFRSIGSREVLRDHPELLRQAHDCTEHRLCPP